MVSTMGKKLAKDDDGLTPQEAAAARAYASGLGQADAYRTGFHGQSKPSTIHSKASVLFARPDIKARIRDLLRAAKISDITSVGEHIHRMVEARAEAFAEKNYTAAASWDKTIAQCLAMTQHRVTVSVMGDLTDTQLIERIAGDDKVLAAALADKLGAASTFT